MCINRSRDGRSHDIFVCWHGGLFHALVVPKFTNTTVMLMFMFPRNLSCLVNLMNMLLFLFTPDQSHKLFNQLFGVNLCTCRPIRPPSPDTNQPFDALMLMFSITPPMQHMSMFRIGHDQVVGLRYLFLFGGHRVQTCTGQYEPHEHFPIPEPVELLLPTSCLPNVGVQTQKHDRSFAVPHTTPRQTM